MTRQVLYAKFHPDTSLTELVRNLPPRAYYCLISSWSSAAAYPRSFSSFDPGRSCRYNRDPFPQRATRLTRSSSILDVLFSASIADDAVSDKVLECFANLSFSNRNNLSSLHSSFGQIASFVLWRFYSAPFDLCSRSGLSKMKWCEFGPLCTRLQKVYNRMQIYASRWTRKTLGEECVARRQVS